MAAMTILRRAAERGRTRLDWLDSRHTFSFGEFFDPAWQSFRSLRVLNDDVIAPGTGFGTHGHRDMEIVSVVLGGSLEHRDSLDHGAVLRPGEVQVMSAGRGIRHSERNPSQTEPTRLLQVWLVPRRRGATPRWEQKAFPWREERDRWHRVVGGDAGNDGALLIDQDADLRVAALSEGARLRHVVAEGRGAWLHVATGRVRVGRDELSDGDAAGLQGGVAIEIEGGAGGGSVLLFDLA